MRAFDNQKSIQEDMLRFLETHNIIYDQEELDFCNFLLCSTYLNAIKRLQKTYGIPSHIFRYASIIFPHLNKSLKKDWPMRFMKSFKIGEDYSLVHYKFQKAILLYFYENASKNSTKNLFLLENNFIIKTRQIILNYIVFEITKTEIEKLIASIERLIKELTQEDDDLFDIYTTNVVSYVFTILKALYYDFGNCSECAECYVHSSLSYAERALSKISTKEEIYSLFANILIACITEDKTIAQW